MQTPLAACVPGALLLTLLASPSSLAQTQLSPTSPPAGQAQQPVAGQTRNAGTYHVTTQTWTRQGASASSMIFGPDVIYSNTAPSGYFSTAGASGGFAPGSINIDEGFIPVRGNPDYPGADRAEYSINGFQISYCSFGSPASAGWEFTFYEQYEACEAAPAPTATIPVTGLPTGLGCWTLEIDLAGGQEFAFRGEGGVGPGIQRPRTFGWGHRYIGSDPAALAGFILAGDPSSTDPSWVPGLVPQDGSNTYYGQPSLCSNVATGNHNVDSWYLEGGMDTGCYFFGGYRNSGACGSLFRPYTAFHMEIYADAGPGNESLGSVFCTSPANSTGVTSALSVSGSDSAAANNVLLAATVPPLSFGAFLASQSTGSVANYMGSQGTLCLGGSIGLFGGRERVKNSGPDGVLLLDTQWSLWSVDAIPDATGTYSASAGLTTYFQAWHRDRVNGVSTSNFSDAIGVTWTL